MDRANARARFLTGLTYIFLYSNLFIMNINLSEQELQKFKEQLEKEAGELELQVKSSSKTPEFGNDTEGDLSEEADEAEEFSAKIGEKEVYKERLADIEIALDKIIRGQYGACEKCGGEISLEVLKVNPESKLCRNCKVGK
mgnify:CR=1 FL=1